MSRDLKKVKKNLKKKRIDKSLDQIEDLLDILSEKKEDFLIADSSPHGWLAVSCVRNKSALPKDLSRKVERVNTKLDRDRGTKPQNTRGRGTFRGRSNWTWNRHYGGRSGGHSEYNQDQDIRTARNQRQTPQELLQALGKQKKIGSLFPLFRLRPFLQGVPQILVFRTREPENQPAGRSRKLRNQGREKCGPNLFILGTLSAQSIS